MRLSILLILALAVPALGDSCYLLKGPGMDPDAYATCKDQALDAQRMSDKIDAQMLDMQHTAEVAGNNTAIADDSHALAPAQPITINSSDDTPEVDK